MIQNQIKFLLKKEITPKGQYTILDNCLSWILHIVDQVDRAGYTDPKYYYRFFDYAVSLKVFAENLKISRSSSFYEKIDQLYEKSKKYLTVKNQPSRSKCSNCYGEGRATCITCYGGGTISFQKRRYWPNNMGFDTIKVTERCIDCGGTGKRHCSRCNGSGLSPW